MKFDVYTFVDASVGYNKSNNSVIGVYGFIHMIPNIQEGILLPEGYGFQTMKSKNTDLLEANALYLALTDLERIKKKYKILLITDSNSCFYKMQSYLASENPKELDWIKKMNEHKRMIIECAKIYKKLKDKKHKVKLALCYSHCSAENQMTFLKKSGKCVEDSLLSYAKNLNCGNYLIDYIVNKIACDGNLEYIKQHIKASSKIIVNIERE